MGLMSLISWDSPNVEVDTLDLVPVESRLRHFNSFK